MDDQKERLKTDPDLRSNAQVIGALFFCTLWLPLVFNSRGDRGWLLLRLELCVIASMLGLLVQWILRYSELDRTTFTIPQRIKTILNYGSIAVMIGSLLFMVYVFIADSQR